MGVIQCNSTTISTLLTYRTVDEQQVGQVARSHRVGIAVGKEETNAGEPHPPHQGPETRVSRAVAATTTIPAVFVGQSSLRAVANCPGEWTTAGVLRAY